VFLYNLTTGQVIRRFRGHKGIVNSVDVQLGGAGRGLIASASDDGNVLVWDEDEKAPVETIELGYPLTSVSSLTFISTAAVVVPAQLDGRRRHRGAGGVADRLEGGRAKLSLS